MQLKTCETPVGQTQSMPSASQASKQKVPITYTDSLPTQLQNDNPAGFLTYAVEMVNSNGRSAGLSNLVRVPLARTLPPPQNFAARVTGQGVVFTWDGDLQSSDSTSTVHYVDRVYRRPEASAQQAVVGEIPAGSEHTLTDSNFEWENTYEYRLERVTVVAQPNNAELQIEGDETPAIKVYTHDVFPPAVPSALQAVSSGPGQKTFIDLVWAPVGDVDLDGYNVYRHQEGTSPVKLNPEPVKTPAYRDTGVERGKRYFYSVSAVDVRGNESTHSDEAAERVP